MGVTPAPGRWHRVARALWRGAYAGLAVGALVGTIFVALAVVGGDSAWAGLLLPAGVFSFPAGLWVIDLLSTAIAAGVPGAALGVLVLAPAVNGAAVGTVLGALAGLAALVNPGSGRR